VYEKNIQHKRNYHSNEQRDHLAQWQSNNHHSSHLLLDLRIHFILHIALPRLSPRQPSSTVDRASRPTIIVAWDIAIAAFTSTGVERAS
jgi:hypothetical protein